jgi:hypothetical protein
MDVLDQYNLYCNAERCGIHYKLTIMTFGHKGLQDFFESGSKAG